MTNIKKLQLLSLSLLFLFSSNPSFGRVQDTLSIIAGTAKLTGTITPPKGAKKDGISVNIAVSHPISGEFVRYTAMVDSSGKFSIDMDVETTISLVLLSTSLNEENYLFVKLTNSEVTNLDIVYNFYYDIEKIAVTPAMMTQYEMLRSPEVGNEMIEYESVRKTEPYYNKSTDFFLNYAKAHVSEKLTVVNKDSLISNDLKAVLTKDFRLWMYVGYVFPYEQQMMSNYRNSAADQSKKPEFIKIDRTYFRFLKDFNLNDPQYLNCFNFLEFQKSILRNEIVNLPEIGETELPTWLASVKSILSELVGFKDGQYYTILAANAYARQLTEEVRPLSEKQRENIVKYWKNGEIAKILFRKNEQVIDGKSGGR